MFRTPGELDEHDVGLLTAELGISRERYAEIVATPVRKGYDPNQPRAPKGDPEGGQWVSAVRNHTAGDEYFASAMDRYLADPDKYKPLNGITREQLEEQIALMVEAFSEQKLDKDRNLFRGMVMTPELGTLEDALERGYIEFRKPVSFSTDSQTARGYADESAYQIGVPEVDDNAKGVVLVFAAKKGQPAIHADPISGDDLKEWVLPAGKFKISRSHDAGSTSPGGGKILWVYGELESDLKKAYNPDQPRAPRGDPRGGQWVASDAYGNVGRSAGGPHAAIAADQRGVHDEESDTYAGVTSEEWTDWAHESEAINDALNGKDIVGSVGGAGDTIDAEDAAYLLEVGRKIQAAAEVNGVSDRIYRGVSFESEAEMKALYPHNKLITLDRLTSTTTDKSIAAIYAASNEDDSGRVRAVIEFGSGNNVNPGIQTSPMGVPTNEIVLPKGISYRVASKIQVNGVWQISLYNKDGFEGLTVFDATPRD